jgi:two-component system NtrC family sensor kinase
VTGQRPDVLGDIVSGLPIAMYRTTVAGRFVAGNAALVALLGAESFDQLLSIHAREIYADPSRRDWLIRRAEAGLPIPVEDLQIRRFDGDLRWVRVSSHSVRGEDGEIAYFEGVMEDVTTLHAVDAQLQRSNELLDTLTRMQDQYIAGADVGELFDGLLADLLTSTGSAYGFIAQLLHDHDGPFLRTWAMTDISWNETTREMYARFGPRGMEFHNLDTLFGRVITDDAPVISNAPLTDPRASGRPDGHPPLDSFLGVPIRRGEKVTGIVALANREGGFDEELVHFLAPLTATVGSLIEAATVDRERIEAERRQAGHKKLHRLIVEEAADAIVTFRDDGRIVLANRAARELIGAAESDLIDHTVWRFLPPRRARAYAQRAAEAMQAASTLELEVRRLDGTTCPVEGTFVRGHYDDDDVTTVIVRDIAAHKATEEALRQARDVAESTARAKDELLAGVSHELRSPLNAVIGLSSVLQRELHGPLTDRQRKFVAQIESSGRHLLDVITTILELAKTEAGKLNPVLVDCDVAETVAEAIGVVNDLAVRQQLSVSVDVPADLPLIRVDAVRFRATLINLLSNAVKFTPPGGRIGVRARTVPGALQVTVWDTGIGIASEDLERIFEPFEQGDSSLARPYDGTGLGLTLSRRLAEVMGGTLSVTSELGRGSEFTVVFPVTEKAAPHRV